MKKQFLILLMVLPLLAGASCKREPEPDPLKPNYHASRYPTKLSVVWHVPFHSDSIGDRFLNPLLTKDYLILSNRWDDIENKRRGIGVFHKLTGKRHAAWLDDPGGILDFNDRLLDCKIGGVNNDIIFVSNRYRIYAFDLNTKQRLWKTAISDEGAALSYISIVGGKPFLAYSFYDDTRARLARFDIQSSQKEDIIELLTEDNYPGSIRPLEWLVAGNGDTLLFFTTSEWNFITTRGRIKAYCYNLTQREIVWKKSDFSVDHDAGVFPPIVTNEQNILMFGARSIHCFNIATSELLWQYDYSAVETFSFTPPLYRNGKLYMREDTGILYCYDAATGTELWSNKTINAIPAPHGSMDIYDGYLYFSGWRESEIGLYCVSAHTGELRWFDQGPNGVISYGVLVDQNLGYLYCQSGIFVMCIDLKKTPVSQ